MLLGAIDIGTNAVRLFLAHAYDNEGFPEVKKNLLVRIPIQLGIDVFDHARITAERKQNLIDTLKSFKLLLGVYRPERYIACATSAMREAMNRDEVLKTIKEEAGINVKVLNGLQEANIIRLTNRLQHSNDYDLSMFIDVGGGSTEISLISDKQLISLQSFKIGTIRLLNNKVPKGEWDKLFGWLDQYKPHFGRINMIGSGGNINKLNKLYGRPNENILILTNLKYGRNQLKGFTTKERIEIMGLRPDRADVIIPASEIFLAILEYTKMDAVLVPKIGLTDGLIHLLYKDVTGRLEADDANKEVLSLFNRDAQAFHNKNLN